MLTHRQPPHGGYFFLHFQLNFLYIHNAMPPIRKNATANIMPMAHAVANWSAVIIYNNVNMFLRPYGSKRQSRILCL